MFLLLIFILTLQFGPAIIAQLRGLKSAYPIALNCFLNLCAALGISLVWDVGTIVLLAVHPLVSIAAMCLLPIAWVATLCHWIWICYQALKRVEEEGEEKKNLLKSCM